MSPSRRETNITRQLTLPEYVKLARQLEHTPPLSDTSGSGQHMVLVSVLNALGFNPRGKAEALELAEELVAAGYITEEDSA